MKVAVFYYTQSGQALSAAHHIFSPLPLRGGAGVGSPNPLVVYKPIVPKQQYPFPWSTAEFFDTFPETRLGLPPSGIEPIDFSDIQDADLVAIVGQSWFLSPSLPLQSFLTDSEATRYLNGRNVVFVNVCRNMWLMTIRSVKTSLHNAGARLVGHIVLQDEAPNLVSALTIVRWLIQGKKSASRLLPAAGVSDSHIVTSARFGAIIRSAVAYGQLSALQSKLLDAGAINYKPSILFLEKAGHRMFGLWAKFIRRKGGFRNPHRLRRVYLFYYYLLVVLFVVSPFAQLFFFLTYPLQRVGRHRLEDCGV